MDPVLISQPLAGRTILVAPSGDGELPTELARHGARVITWPEIEVIDPESFAALDEAIQNLFGYDWLIFANVNAASFFLRRLQQMGNEISELDALRVCALDDATRQHLEHSQVHVDLVPEQLSSDGVVAALGTYIGEKDSLGGLNVLLPRAAVSRDPLPQALEDAGARVDVVTAYRTVSDNSELTRLNVLIEGGGIDCIAFSSPATVGVFAQIFDTNDLSRLLKEVVVACADDDTAVAAAEFGLRTDIIPTEPTPLVSALVARLGSPGH